MLGLFKRIWRSVAPDSDDAVLDLRKVCKQFGTDPAVNALIDIDLVVRRGQRLVFCEVKAKGGPGFGDPLEMITPEKVRRLARAGEAWLAAHPETAGLEISYEAVGLSAGRFQRVPLII